MIFAPTDGKTYGNDCERQQAMVSKAHNGRRKNRVAAGRPFGAIEIAAAIAPAITAHLA